MAKTAIIEYQWKGYISPGEGQAWDIEATVTHMAGIVISTGKELLADLRTELEEAGLRKAGASIITKYSNPARPGQWLPRWREVWQHKDKVAASYNNQLSPHARKTRQQSAARTRLYQSRQKEERMKDDARLMELASKASQRFPELRGRPVNAAELVRAGKVKRISTTTFRVESQDGEKLYTVDIHRRTCNCYDAQNNKPRWCKHHLAALMKVKLGQPATTDAGEIHRQEKQFASALKAGIIV